MELEGKTAIVTGSARGIGEGIAMVLVREGANVVINSRKAEECADVVKKITAAGGRAIAIGADVSKKAEVAAMVAETVKQFGAVDILVNNAGIESHPVLTMELAEESWDRVLNVNLKGTFLCCQAVIPQMMKQNKGRIINIGSTASIRIAFFGSVEYTASKYGQAGLAQHLAWELADSNITVNTVCPGSVQTPLMEAGTTPEYREMTVKRLIPLGRFTHDRGDRRDRELSRERSRGHDHRPDARRRRRGSYRFRRGSTGHRPSTNGGLQGRRQALNLPAKHPSAQRLKDRRKSCNRRVASRSTSAAASCPG